MWVDGQGLELGGWEQGVERGKVWVVGAGVGWGVRGGAQGGCMRGRALMRMLGQAVWSGM